MTKALTLWQPWASLVALGVKTIETRSWSTSYRGPLAIHAAKTPPEVNFPVGVFNVCWHRIQYPDHVDEGYTLTRTDGTPDDHGVTANPVWPLPLGAVVATCTLVDVVPIEATYLTTDDLNMARSRLDSRPARDWMQTRDFGTAIWHEQRPYGDFSPGRFAWLLADIEPLSEPVPAKGRQGLWEWTP